MNLFKNKQINPHPYFMLFLHVTTNIMYYGKKKKKENKKGMY